MISSDDRRAAPLAFALALLLLVPAGAATQEAPQRPDPDVCRKRAEARQLDFWIGTWDVYHPEDGRKLGTNVIEPMLNDCALLESWTSARGSSGKSLNFYDAQRQTWRQVWVDEAGGVLDYRRGEYRDGAMHFSGITIDAQGDTTLQKLIFHDVSPDTVRQVFESSKDGGQTWSRDWVGIYVRRSGS